jgi:proline iminopeptidase
VKEIAMRRIRLVVVLAMAVVACAAGGGAWAAPAAPDGPGKTFTTPGGAKIWYDVRGRAAGRPLFMVNGGPGFDHQYVLCSDAWDTIARTRRVVMYDQRGNGKSGALAKGESCTLADQVADLDALRAQLGVDKIDLLGHSWGGYLVMAYSARHPEHAAHLCIIDSASPKWTDTDFIFKYIFPEGVEDQSRLDFFDGLGDSTAGKRSLDEYMGMLFLSTAKRDEFMSHKSAYHYNRSVNETLNGDLGKFDMWPALPGFSMPTLVACGRYDINVAPSTAWKIHKAIPGSRWQVFEKSGHLPYFEEPALFVQTINDFLGAP